ncbi:MAG: amino acid ABC transporter substrate-binding protein [Deltaproteobacteria bacterium]|nr:amino acid ABC transporter substrate-binding protein [Deltaproteobacteria bacterium]
MNRAKSLFFIPVVAALWLGSALPARSAPDGGLLKTVLSRGELRCGVNGALSGFGYMDPKGRMVGFDVDFCRAVSAALFGSADKVRFIRLSAAQRFTALQSGEIDLLSRNTSWTISRDVRLGMDFGPVVFYDGQGMLVKKNLKVHRLKDLSGATICVQSGTTSEKNLADGFQSRGIVFKPLVNQDYETTVGAFIKNRCDGFTSDLSQLLATQMKYPELKNTLILDEVFSKEPMAPAVRQGDSRWRDVVSWVIYGMLAAEELGITGKNLEAKLQSKDNEIRRLLGREEPFGEELGLPNNFMAAVIGQVGNYGEVFNRHLGAGSPFKLKRGVNDLWTRGGLMYSPPFR